LLRSQIIYINHRGRFENIGEVISRIKDDFSKHFRISNFFAIYYNDERAKEDKNLSRSTVGLMVNPGEVGKINLFMK
jgi:hypothetical protein